MRLTSSGTGSAGPAGCPGGATGRPRLILLHHIVDSMVDSFFPRLSEFDDHIDEPPGEIFARPSNDQLAELFNMQRWLVTARKLVSPQRDVMAALVGGHGGAARHHPGQRPVPARPLRPHDPGQRPDRQLP